MIAKDTCGAEEISADLWWLVPGQQSDPDVHQDSVEIYWVVRSQGNLVLAGDEFEMSKGMAVYIPPCG